MHDRRSAGRGCAAWLAAAIAIGILGACATPPTLPPAPNLAQPAYPPGALNPDVTQETIQRTICVKGWTPTVRPSPLYTNGVKKKLLREQGIPVTEIGNYELDHYIPLTLGGHPRDSRNLWLQPWEGPRGARAKDRLERVLNHLVCRGELTLDRAREDIGRDWVRAYDRYVERAWSGHDEPSNDPPAAVGVDEDQRR